MRREETKTPTSTSAQTWCKVWESTHYHDRICAHVNATDSPTRAHAIAQAIVSPSTPCESSILSVPVEVFQQGVAGHAFTDALDTLQQVHALLNRHVTQAYTSRFGSDA